MLITKYDYTPLSRKEINGKRHYLLPDGSKVASVTTILDKTKTEEKKAILHNWRKRMGSTKATEITTEAAGVGTRMHSYLEGYIKTGVLREAGTNPYSLQSRKMAQTIIDNAFPNISEAWGIETNLFYPEIYAGTTDLVGTWRGEPAIIDFKQTNRPKKTEWIDDYFIQLTAYSAAHDKMFDTDIKCGVILMCSRANEFQHWVIRGQEFTDWQHKWWNRVEEYYSNN
jgi:ATP-dependent exoDNAse (exonuclease V) beta subunit